VTKFISKLADTVLWSSIGAVVLGLILKFIQMVQASHKSETQAHPRALK
jgi:hypothetical protein